MLDLLFNAKKAERHPVELVFIGIFYSSISILLGSWVFDEYRSLAIVFLTVFSCLYIVQGAIRSEEKKDRDVVSESWLLREHKRTIFLILSLFVGFTISFSLWSFFLPVDTSSSVFELQKVSVDQIRSITGNAVSSGPLFTIFFNNVKIIVVSLIFALVYGAGAVYILVWNASVMGYVIGSIAQQASYGLAAVPVVMFKYFLHGIPEMLAYIVAAFAGGILFFAFARGDLLHRDRSRSIIVDVLALLVISVALLVVAALIEVYISAFI
jgi:uncharacterized membrane protein SpoIIM required for sporulation